MDLQILISDRETGDRLSKIVDEACLLLAEYNGRLAAELEDRVDLSKMLSGFIALQKEKLVEAEKRLEVKFSHGMDSWNPGSLGHPCYPRISSIIFAVIYVNFV